MSKLMFHGKYEDNQNVLRTFRNFKKKNIEPHQNFIGSYKQGVEALNKLKNTEYHNVKR